MLFSIVAAPFTFPQQGGRGPFSPALICVARTPLLVPTLCPSGSLQARETIQQIEQGSFRPKQLFQRSDSVHCWAGTVKEMNCLGSTHISKEGFPGVEWPRDAM